MAYDPRPSQTRYGQRVDNPPIENSDTAKLRVLVMEETQDEWHKQRELNNQIISKLTVLHEWRKYVTEREAHWVIKASFNLLRILGGVVVTGIAIAMHEVWNDVHELKAQMADVRVQIAELRK